MFSIGTLIFGIADLRSFYRYFPYFFPIEVCSSQCMDYISDSLISTLSVIFHNGVPPVGRVTDNENRGFLAFYKKELQEYNETKTISAANDFLTKAFARLQDDESECSLQTMCIKSSCTVCTNLYGIFGALRLKLLAKRKKAYSDYLVIQISFCLTYSQSEVFLLGYIDFLYATEEGLTDTKLFDSLRQSRSQVALISQLNFIEGYILGKRHCFFYNDLI